MGIVYKDEGHGITDKSIEFWKRVKPNLGRIDRAIVGQAPLEVELHKDEGGFKYDAEYNLMLFDAQGNEVWLSGCNCGYGGTGPHGTFDVLKDAGLLAPETSFEESGLAESGFINFLQDGRRISEIRKV